MRVVLVVDCVLLDYFVSVYSLSWDPLSLAFVLRCSSSFCRCNSG